MPLLINPTNPENEPVLSALIAQQPGRFTWTAFEPVYLRLNGVDTSILLTHSLVRLHKEEKPSRHRRFARTAPYDAEAIVPKGKWILAVYESNRQDKGCFGSIYEQRGRWEAVNKKLRYRRSRKPKLIKIDVSESSNNDVMTERELASLTPHMGCRYLVAAYRSERFILMNKQQGISLEHLLKLQKQDPSILTTTERLQISLALLTVIKTQAHGINVGEGQIIHNDIKPGNIMVSWSPWLVVNLVDYGLAKASKRKDPHPGSFPGTALYMEPELAAGNQGSRWSPYSGSNTQSVHQKPVKLSPGTSDKYSDLFSLALVLAELWGDISRDRVSWSHQLMNQNKNFPLEGLFSGISDLNDGDKKAIKDLLFAMTREYRQERAMSRKKARAVFSSILTRRIVAEKDSYTQASDTDFTQLDGAALYRLLKSVKAELLLDRLEQNPALMPEVIKRLGHRIFHLDDTLFYALLSRGARLANDTLLTNNIQRETTPVEVLTKIIQLTPNISGKFLKYWLEHAPLQSAQAHRWISICRTLYQITPNAAEVVQKAKVQSDFKSCYLSNFLGKPHDTPEQDRVNAHAILYASASGHGFRLFDHYQEAKPPVQSEPLPVVIYP